MNEASAVVQRETTSSRTDGQADRQMDNQTDRQTCAQASRSSPLLIPLCITEVGGSPEGGMFSFRFA